MPSLFDISQDTTAFPWAKRTPLAGIPTVAAMVIALIIGWKTGHESAGAIAAGSAFTIGFAVFHERLASTLLSMGIVTLGISSATLAASLGAERTWVVLVLTVVAAINYAVLAGLSPTAGWMGQQCAVFAVVASYFPGGPRYALGRTAMVLSGGVLQIALSTVALLLQPGRTAAAGPSLRARITARWSGLICKLRQTRLGDSTTSYAVRLACTLLLSTEIYRHYQIRNGYWVPMTALLVLKPQWSDTLSRGIARLAGTIAGAGIALLLARTVPFNMPTVFAMVAVCAWGCYALQAVNYAAFSLFVTLYIVFLFRFGGFSQTSAAHIRLFNTLLGGTIALFMDALWKLIPRWPRPVQAEAAPAGAPHDQRASVQ